MTGKGEGLWGSSAGLGEPGQCSLGGASCQQCRHLFFLQCQTETQKACVGSLPTILMCTPACFLPSRNTIHITAPGEAILATTYDGGYGLMWGTSMATPVVTGAAALVQSTALAAGVTLTHLVGRRVERGKGVSSESCGRLACKRWKITLPCDTQPPRHGMARHSIFPLLKPGHLTAIKYTA